MWRNVHQDEIVAPTALDLCNTVQGIYLRPAHVISPSLRLSTSISLSVNLAFQTDEVIGLFPNQVRFDRSPFFMRVF